MTSNKILTHPLKSRKLETKYLNTNDAGNFLISSEPLDSLVKSEKNLPLILKSGMGYQNENDIYDLGYRYKRFVKNTPQSELNYFIIIPTLRCNLSCSYCQVSRAHEAATGFDWSENEFDLFLEFFAENSGSVPKVEIQGGEPLLVFDKLKDLITRIFEIRASAEVVICTNLQTIPKGFWEFIKPRNIYISTSIDGNIETHNRNRNKNLKSTNAFFANLHQAFNILGNNRVSALPTITDFGEINSVIDSYKDFNILDIFLRPVNYQGFARKKYSDASKAAKDWLHSYLKAMNYIFENNENSENKIREINFAIHLKRIFDINFKSHVDFRNPSYVGQDYLVINYDGVFFPSDEARMLHRIGVIDLSIGNLESGLNKDIIKKINTSASLSNYEDCNKCAYKPFCGIDIVDIISRHGTLDLKMLDTHHCKTHLGIFDFIFNKFGENDPIFIKNINLHLTGNYEFSNLLSGLVHD